jgi:hypothetical protein
MLAMVSRADSRADLKVGTTIVIGPTIVGAGLQADDRSSAGLQAGRTSPRKHVPFFIAPTSKLYAIVCPTSANVRRVPRSTPALTAGPVTINGTVLVVDGGQWLASNRMVGS